MGLVDRLRHWLRIPTHDDREESYERTRRTINRADEALRDHAAAARSRRAIDSAARRVERIERSVADGYRERR